MRAVVPHASLQLIILYVKVAHSPGEKSGREAAPVCSGSAIQGETHMKSILSGLGALVITTALSGAPALAQDAGSVGISMPTQSSARWISDGNSMVELFEEAGYATDLQYAEDDIPNQLAQIENMIVRGVDVLVIASIDGTTLTSALENAAANGISVIAYDRLIRGSEHVDYYATFDNFT